MKQLRMVAAVCAFSLSMAQVKAEDRFLVDEGKAYAEIIISESPARSTRLAAAEVAMATMGRILFLPPRRLARQEPMFFN